MSKPSLSPVDSQQGALQSRPSAKAPSHRDRILALLRSRGAAGVTNLELNGICFRYGARIFELRRQGFCIATQPEGEGVYRFVLRQQAGAQRQAASETLPLFAGVSESLGGIEAGGVK